MHFNATSSCRHGQDVSKELEREHKVQYFMQKSAFCFCLLNILSLTVPGCSLFQSTAIRSVYEIVYIGT